MKKKNGKMILLISFVAIGSYCLGKIDFSELKIDYHTEQNKKALAVYIEGDDGEYTLSSSNKFPTDGYTLNLEKSTCTNGGKLSQNTENKAISMSTSNKSECNLYFEKEKNVSLETVIDHLNISSKGIKNNFDTAATTDEGIFTMEDDYGTSYYYRGAVTNNYVKFGKNMYNNDMYWRIIRINGDGSMRIMYSGTQAYANGTSDKALFALANQVWNTANDDAKYVGWMYAPEGTAESTTSEEAQTNLIDSEIKTAVDNWYKENILDTGYHDAIADVLFCGDRGIPGTDKSDFSSDTGLGYGKNRTAYNVYTRFINDGKAKTGIQPTLKCYQKNDAYTVNDTSKGNGALTYPVGLITTDEMVAAGSGKYYLTNKNYYLYRQYTFTGYWTFSPSYFDGSGASIFATNEIGTFTPTYVNDGKYVAPVINLTPEYVTKMIGTGTMTNPYRVE